MIFAYTKYNLGTDFTVFWVLAIIFATLAAMSACTTIGYCFHLEARPAPDSGRMYEDSDRDMGREIPVIEET